MFLPSPLPSSECCKNLFWLLGAFETLLHLPVCSLKSGSGIQLGASFPRVDCTGPIALSNPRPHPHRWELMMMR